MAESADWSEAPVDLRDVPHERDTVRAVRACQLAGAAVQARDWYPGAPSGAVPQLHECGVQAVEVDRGQAQCTPCHNNRTATCR